MKLLTFLSIASMVIAGLSAETTDMTETKKTTDTADTREVRGSVEVRVPITYDYLVQLPEGYDADADRKWPVLLFLHGSGERGEDLDLVRIWGPPRFITEGGDLPFIVVSPQCPDGIGWMPQVLIGLLDEVGDTFRVDEDRVVVTGLSMGGSGTWSLAAAAPERFAAIAPICGWANQETAAQLVDLPIWVFHGARDEVVELQGSTEMVNALNELGASVRFTVYPDGDHGDAWKKAYNESGLFGWLAQAVRP